MKLMLVFALLIVQCLNLTAQKHLFEIDGGHSYIEFSVDYLGMMKQHGKFNKFDCAIVYDNSNQKNTSVTCKIQANSIDTGHSFRDKHLKSPDFFDTKKYPTIFFKSTGIIMTGDQLKIRGDFIMHGITKTIDIPFKSTGIIIDWEGKQRIGFEGEFSLNRKEFDILGGNTFNSRFVKDRVIGDIVDISFSIQVVLKNKTTWQPTVDFLESISQDGFQEVLSKTEEKLSTSEVAEESLTLLSILYSATGSLMYNQEYIQNAIQILNLVEKNPFTDDRLSIRVVKRLTLCYWLAGNNKKANEYLMKVKNDDPDSPFVNEVSKLLNH